MKKFSLLLIIVFISIIVLTGCDKLVKNPRTITVKLNKGEATLVFDETRQTKLNSLANNFFLQNEAFNYSLYFGSYSNKKDELDNLLKEFKEDKDSKFLEMIKINKYTGFGKVNKKTGAAEIYMILNKKKSDVLTIRVNAMNAKKLKIDENKPEKAVYKTEAVSEILNTLKYKDK